MLKLKKLFLCALIIVVTPLQASFDLREIIGIGSANIPLRGIDTRHKQLEILQEEREKVIAKAEEEKSRLGKEINEISARLDSKKVEFEDPEAQKSMSNILKDRKHELSSTIELHEEYIKTYNEHIKLVDSIIETLKKTDEDSESKKLYYVWKEYKDAQSRIGQHISKINALKGKIKAISDEQKVERDRLALLVGEKEKEAKTSSLKQDGLIRLHQQRFYLLDDKIDRSKLKIDVFEAQIHYKNDFVQQLEYRLDFLRKKMPVIEKNLVLNIANVELAKEEWRAVKEEALNVIEQLNKQRDQKRKERSELAKLRDELKKKIEVYVVQGDAKTIEHKTEKYRLIRAEALIALTELEIDLLHAQREFQDGKAVQKEQQAAIIEVRYKLSREEGDIEEWLLFFKNQKDLALNSIKVLEHKRNEIISLSDQRNRVLEDYRVKLKEIEEQKTAQKKHLKIYQDIQQNLKDAIDAYHKQHTISQEYTGITSDLIHLNQKIVDEGHFIITELESRKISLSIWKRSPKAISFDGLKQSLLDAESFVVRFFWETPNHLSPVNILATLRLFDIYDYILILLAIFFFFVLLFLVRKGLMFVKQRIDNSIRLGRGAFGLYLNVFKAMVAYLIERSVLILLWLYLFFLIQMRGSYLPLPFHYITSSYFATLFYLVSIFVFVYLARHFLIMVKTLNQKLSFLFFTEKFQDKFIFLITISLYASAIAIPLRQAFLNFSTTASDFPAVILAAYSLVLVVVLLFFFNKDDVLKLVPSQTDFFIWLKRKIDRYYYPVFIFFMGLLILSNPYIGYSNLAWFLAFAVPSSAFLLYGTFFVHNQLRKYSAFFFIREEEDQVIDKFEHGKTYYGFFIVISFLALTALTCVVIARIWGFRHTLVSLWHSLSDVWVIRDVFITGTKLGFVEFITLFCFVAGGFVVSSLLNKLVLNKLFDIFRTEPGTQNTVTLILQYIVVFFAVILGFTAIKLGPVVAYVSTGLFAAVLFGLKDLVSDFFAGFWVLIERPIEIGHFIQTGELRGTVQKIAVRATTVRTAQNYSVVVPNRELVSKPIINWGGGRYAVGFEITIVVNYGANTETVTEIIRDVIQRHPLVLRVPNIVIRLDDLTDTGMQFFARAFISSRRVRDQWDIASDIRMEVIQVLAKHGISIPYPHRVIHQAGDEGAVSGAHSYEHVVEQVLPAQPEPEETVQTVTQSSETPDENRDKPDSSNV